LLLLPWPAPNTIVVVSAAALPRAPGPPAYPLLLAPVLLPWVFLLLLLLASCLTLLTSLTSCLTLPEGIGPQQHSNNTATDTTETITTNT
jgi:hypothetical protein